LARSRSAGRRPVSRRPAAPDVAPPSSGVGLAPGPSLVSATLPRAWHGIGYRPLPDARAARALFDFAAVVWPDTVAGAARSPSTEGGLPQEGRGSVGLAQEGRGSVEFCWGAHAAAEGMGERVVGAIVGQRAERAMMLHGPVVAVDGEEPLEIAAQLVTAALDHAQALGVETVFARPQGLDRIWIRYGFIPVPEGALPSALGGGQAVGLYAWRGGTALWTFRERPQSE
jgi:hypothetical protein